MSGVETWSETIEWKKFGSSARSWALSSTMKLVSLARPSSSTVLGMLAVASIDPLFTAEADTSESFRSASGAGSWDKSISSLFARK